MSGAPHEDGALVLYQHPPAWGLPTTCPRCLAAHALLRWGGLGSFQTDSGGNSAVSPTASLPALEDGEAFVGSFEGVRHHLRETRGRDLDAWLGDGARAQLAAFNALTEAQLCTATESALWLDQDNYQAVTKPVFVAAHAWFIGWRMADCRRRAARTARPAGATDESLLARGSEALQALSSQLKGPYLFGEQPTSLDATLLGQLLVHLYCPLPHHPLRDVIAELPNLVAFARRGAAECFGKLPEPIVDGANGTAGAGHSAKGPRERPAKRTYTPAEQAFHETSRWYMIGIAVATTAFSVLSWQFTQDHFDFIQDQIATQLETQIDRLAEEAAEEDEE